MRLFRVVLKGEHGTAEEYALAERLNDVSELFDETTGHNSLVMVSRIEDLGVPRTITAKSV